MNKSFSTSVSKSNTSTKTLSNETQPSKLIEITKHKNQKKEKSEIDIYIQKTEKIKKSQEKKKFNAAPDYADYGFFQADKKTRRGRNNRRRGNSNFSRNNTANNKNWEYMSKKTVKPLVKENYENLFPALPLKDSDEKKPAKESLDTEIEKHALKGDWAKLKEKSSNKNDEPQNLTEESDKHIMKNMENKIYEEEITKPVINTETQNSENVDYKKYAEDQRQQTSKEIPIPNNPINTANEQESSKYIEEENYTPGKNKEIHYQFDKKIESDQSTIEDKINSMKISIEKMNQQVKFNSVSIDRAMALIEEIKKQMTYLFDQRNPSNRTISDTKKNFNYYGGMDVRNPMLNTTTDESFRFRPQQVIPQNMECYYPRMTHPQQVAMFQATAMASSYGNKNYYDNQSDKKEEQKIGEGKYAGNIGINPHGASNR